MLETKTEIIRLGDNLIREKGYNAFSFSDISKELNIKNASVHYHFPTKKALGLAVIRDHLDRLKKLKSDSEHKTPVEKLYAYLSIYSSIKTENKICIVGSLATDFQTVDLELQRQLEKLTDQILQWVIALLTEGKTNGIFVFDIEPRVKALMIITNMLGAVQLTRLTGEGDFELIREAVINDLTQKAS